MKRVEALAPLSREHHQALILAQLMKIGTPEYKGLPVLLHDRLDYAVAQYHSHLLPHFKKEEALLAHIDQGNPVLQDLTKSIFADHLELRELFEALPTAENKEMAMNLCGVKLEAHIRREEREWFHLLEEHCPPYLLQTLHDQLLIQQK